MITEKEKAISAGESEKSAIEKIWQDSWKR